MISWHTVIDIGMLVASWAACYLAGRADGKYYAERRRLW